MNVYDVIKSRRSVRAYSDRPIPEAVIGRLRDVLRWAPSACNLQPWQFILVTDPQLRQQVAGVCNKQSWIAPAPLLVVGCANPDAAYKRMGGSDNSAIIDVTIALDHLSLAAAAEGLGTCWIGAFDEAAVKQTLGVPAAVKVVALMPVGYPANPDALQPAPDANRKSPTDIFATDRYPGHE
jgi:nitroreductase